MNSELFVDKYRPSKLKDYILNADIKEYFKNMVKNRRLQHMTLIGCPGSGKTTLAKILCNEFDAETLFVRCATEGTIDVLRTKITEFCNAMSIEGKMKIVVLDEIDSASSSGDNNFQKGLRTLIEQAQDDTRFILTANYNKIIPAILSRCPIIPLKFDKKDLLQYVKKILDNENVKYDRESLKSFIEEAFHYYPDCRKIINYLQFCCVDGELTVKLNALADNDRAELAKDIVIKSIESRNILDVRKFYMQHKEKIGDFVTFSSEIFNYVVDNDLVNANGVLKLTDLNYQINMVVDKEPTFFGMLTAINVFKNK